MENQFKDQHLKEKISSRRHSDSFFLLFPSCFKRSSRFLHWWEEWQSSSKNGAVLQSVNLYFGNLQEWNDGESFWAMKIPGMQPQWRIWSSPIVM